MPAIVTLTGGYRSCGPLSESNEWRDMFPTVRAKLLRRLADLVEEHAVD